ncbi:SDR family oxidoreductase [Pseudonocardia sp. MCCB 268]|nr:SDR family oxidoreductase [Pseudonocardia cytotoxica]
MSSPGAGSGINRKRPRPRSPTAEPGRRRGPLGCGAAETVRLITRRHGAGRAVAHTVDVSDDAAVAELAARVAAEHGVPDVVVNNAGMLPPLAGPFRRHHPRRVAPDRRRQPVGAWCGCQRFSGNAAEHGGGGHLVNLRRPRRTCRRALPAYATTKAAVLMLSGACAPSWPTRIGVTALCPGFVNTPITTATRFAGTDASAGRLKAAAAAYARRGYTPSGSRPGSSGPWNATGRSPRSPPRHTPGCSPPGCPPAQSARLSPASRPHERRGDTRRRPVALARPRRPVRLHRAAHRLDPRQAVRLALRRRAAPAPRCQGGGGSSTCSRRRCRWCATTPSRGRPRVHRPGGGARPPPGRTRPPARGRGGRLPATSSRSSGIFHELLGDRRLSGDEAQGWLVERVGAIAAIRYFTAVLGSGAGLPALTTWRSADAEMLDMLRWHGAEGGRARSVAHDHQYTTWTAHAAPDPVHGGQRAGTGETVGRRGGAAVRPGPAAARDTTAKVRLTTTSGPPARAGAGAVAARQGRC